MKKLVSNEYYRSGQRAGERASSRLIGILIREGRWSDIPDSLSHACVRDLMYEEQGIWRLEGCEKYVPPLDPDVIRKLESVGVDLRTAGAVRDDAYRIGWIVGEMRMLALAARLIRDCRIDAVLLASEDEIREIFFQQYGQELFDDSAFSGRLLLTPEQASRAEGFEKGRKAAAAGSPAVEEGGADACTTLLTTR